MPRLATWLNRKASENHLFFIKRLSANDTGASGSHQSGVYIPLEIMRRVIPSICHYHDRNPSTSLIAKISSQFSPPREIIATYYNNKFFDGSVNEPRLTRWGGRFSPLMNPDYTGALAIFSFELGNEPDCKFLDVWVCSNSYQEEIIQSLIGEIFPGTVAYGLSYEVIGGVVENQTPQKKYNIPPSWHEKFPSGRDIIEFSSRLDNYFFSRDPDALLMKRRSIEYDVFLFIEELHAANMINKGFDSVDSFIKVANSISNRRKSRGGRSLEIHLENILIEFGVTQFSTQAVTEGNKKPDFIFPSQIAYQQPYFPVDKLRVLAVKTTCKDRWRQAVSEANKIYHKHLFTLQEGVSINQFQEMKSAGIQLVVPRELHNKYPSQIREELMTLSDFIEELKSLNY